MKTVYVYYKVGQLSSNVLTIQQAAQAVGIHPKTIRRWEEKGKFIPNRTLGNQRRFTDGDVKVLAKIKNGEPVPPPAEQLLSKNQVAQKFSVSPITIDRWTKAGKLQPAVNDALEPGYKLSEIKKHLQGPSLKEKRSDPVELRSNLVGTPTRLDLFRNYSGIAGLTLSLFAGIYLMANRPDQIASPGIEQNQTPTVDVALPRTAQFLDGRIALGLNTGDLFYADTTGNIYVKDSALINQGVYTRILQLLPTAKPEKSQIGQLYVNQDSGNLQYFDGLEWIDLNRMAAASGSGQLSGSHLLNSEDINLTLGSAIASASATSFRIALDGDQSVFKITGGTNQDLFTVNDDSLYPILLSQPTRILGNLTAPKLIDENNNSYFIDPSSSEISLSLAGNASLSASLKFNQHGESISNSVDDYLVFSGGLGIGGGTTYGFASNGNIEAHKLYARDYLETDTIKIDDNLIQATNGNGLKLFDDGGNGITIADGGGVTINGTAVPDYVFEPDYQLLSPIDLRNYLALYQHLPGVPNSEQIKTNGLNLAETMMAILERVENNTLYILDLYEKSNRIIAPTVETEILTTKYLSPLSQNQIIITGDASVSGTLYASQIESSTIDRLREKISELANNLTPTPEPLPVATAAAILTNLPAATESGHLNLDSLEAKAGFFRDFLAVLGRAEITDLAINNTLTINRLTSLSGRIDLAGNLVINGNLEVTGAIIAQQITPPPGTDLEISIASGSAVSIYADTVPVATFSGLGANLANLQLQASGTATISAGANAATVPVDKISEKSQIVVTFTADSQPATKYWVKKDPTVNRFTVFTNYPVNHDTTLDWLMVN